MNKVKALLLAAGLGTRLSPLTDDWPKCLMPIGERPLLEYWLETLYSTGVKEVLVNLHHHSEKVQEFLNRPRFEDWVSSVSEETLLGTAGTLKANKEHFQNCTTLLVHADNWCQCDFAGFLNYHRTYRPANCPITMMTFESPTPETCGIVETDADGVVVAFHEKSNYPP
ncbi:MAG: nucleotidyltransferase family protein, partial [bacterium]